MSWSFFCFFFCFLWAVISAILVARNHNNKDRISLASASKRLIKIVLSLGHSCGWLVLLFFFFKITVGPFVIMIQIGLFNKYSLAYVI